MAFGICFLCGNAGSLTKEHFFPKWMKAHTPFNSPSQINYQTGAKKNRDVGFRTVNQVCESCNGIWMSKVQQQAKPYITPLLTADNWRPVTLETAKAIAVWTVMTSMVCEATHPEGVHGISPNERMRFAENQKIGPDWQVWIGKSPHAPNRGFSQLPWVSHDGTLDRSSPVTLRSLAAFGQTTVMQAGKLILFAWSGYHPIQATGHLPQWGMLRVWPTIDHAHNPPSRAFPTQYSPRVLVDVLYRKLTDRNSLQQWPFGPRPLHPGTGLQNWQP